jgi:hypothetical protein
MQISLEDQHGASAAPIQIQARLRRVGAYLGYLLGLTAHPDLHIWQRAGDRVVEAALKEIEGRQQDRLAS